MSVEHPSESEQTAVNAAFQTGVVQRFYQSLPAADRLMLGAEPAVRTSSNLAGFDTREFRLILQNISTPLPESTFESLVARRLPSGTIEPTTLYADLDVEAFAHYALINWRFATAVS